jgi:hypothetical protein
LKEELIRMWKMKTAHTLPLGLFTTDITPNKLHKILKLLNLRHVLYILIEKILAEQRISRISEKRSVFRIAKVL